MMIAFVFTAWLTLTCRDAIARRLMQQLASTLDAAGHTVLAAHVRRDRNQYADKLSHTLPPSLWMLIERQQSTHSAARGADYWRFPFVVQCLHSGRCMSGLFKMRASLF